MTAVLGEGRDTSDRVIPREDRWMSGIDMYKSKIYTRNNLADSISVSRKLANAGELVQVGPGKILAGGHGRSRMDFTNAVPSYTP